MAKVATRLLARRDARLAVAYALRIMTAYARSSLSTAPTDRAEAMTTGRPRRTMEGQNCTGRTDRPIWIDFPGLSPQFTQANLGRDFRMDSDFLAFLRGPTRSCSCHFTVVLDWDATNNRYRAATAIALVNDAETVNCVLQ